MASATRHVGVLHAQRAWILLRPARPPRRSEAFDVAIPLLTDPLELGKAYINRGGVHLSRGAGPRAAADFARGVELFRELGNEIEAAMAEHNLGYADLLQGDLVSALHHMDAVRPVLLPLSPVVVAICNQDRAEVLMAAGLTRRGLAALDESARTFGAAPPGTAPRRGRAHHRPGVAGSDPARALAAARAARSRFSRTTHPRPARAGRGPGPRRRGAAGSHAPVLGHARRRLGRGARSAGNAVVGDRHPARRGAGRHPAGRARRKARRRLRGDPGPGAGSARRTAAGAGRACGARRARWVGVPTL